MAEKKTPHRASSPIPVASLLGSHRGTVPHAAGSGSHSLGDPAQGRAGAPESAGTPEPVETSEGTGSLVAGASEAGELVDLKSTPGERQGLPSGLPEPESTEGAEVSNAQPRAGSALRRPAQNLSQRQVLISVLMDNLSTGSVKGPVSSQERKVYSVPLSLPASIHGPLTEVAGDQRQVGETLREALDDLIQQCQFQATLVTYTHSLKRSYEAFVEVRKVARKLGGGGMRPVTVNLTEDAGQKIVSLARDLGTTPVRLLETLAYQLALLAPSNRD